MKNKLLLAALTAIASVLVAATAVAQAPDQQSHNQVWRPAATPKGGVSWQLLESTRLLDRRRSDGMIYTRPQFPQAVQTLNGRQVRVAGYMMPLENGARQSHFVLLAYPPGCPFHMHALPNQFIEVRASASVPVQETRPIVLTGTLQLTGQDESGIFYRLVNARAG